MITATNSVVTNNDVWVIGRRQCVHKLNVQVMETAGGGVRGDNQSDTVWAVGDRLTDPQKFT